MSSHASLSAAADDRKARLAKLKSLKRKQPTEDTTEDEAPTSNDLQQTPQTTSQDRTTSPPTEGVSHLHLSGRNYDPQTKGPKLGFEAPPTLSLETPTLEEQAAQLEEESKRKAAEDAQEDKGIDLFKLQPKKPNWDLKRELDKKLAVLNVQTDNAIARMVRERLEAKKAEAGQAASVKGQTQAQTQKDGEDGAGLLEGAAMVEGIRLREEREAEEERRERELEDAELAA
ncbi:cwf18 pre-mRNA splicing factor-domain-containing protein [Rhypophila decipiens]|uniref:Cwf18 pre-mRNA splicing factor-domain-containing protein n=1 Tax=Rhypophila decipiens TaxID=261697 RepID=A0AAN6YIZ3_9PEZI|nr:cwf18 pre-mRNA splicing factor-domain-containing protein [Rhypophila decipiens]